MAFLARSVIQSTRGLATHALRQHSTAPVVHVFGAGPCGMTTVHDLKRDPALKDAEIKLYDPELHPGGKARSWTDNGVPQEHGLRVMMESYRHMRTILGEVDLGDGATPLDHLTSLDTYTLRHSTAFGPSGFMKVPCRMGADLRSLKHWGEFFLSGEFKKSPLTVKDLCRLTTTSLAFIGSCKARRIAVHETQSLAELVKMDQLSHLAQELFDRAPELFDGVNAKSACGRIYMCKFISQMLALFTSEGVVQVFDRPTNEAVFNPWMAQLAKQGVEFNLGVGVSRLVVDQQQNRLAKVVMQRRDGSEHEIEFGERDIAVFTMALDATQRVFSSDFDPRAEFVSRLKHVPMIGLQIQLKDDVALSGHQVLFDSPWGILFLVQNSALWPERSVADISQGRARSTLSIGLVELDTPGVTGRTLRECASKDEILEELVAQLSVHYDGQDDGGLVHALKTGVVELSTSDHVHLATEDEPLRYTEPLPINSPGDYFLRKLIRWTPGLENTVISGGWTGSKYGLESMENAFARGSTTAQQVSDHHLSVPGLKRVMPDYKIMPRLFDPIRALDAMVFEY